MRSGLVLALCGLGLLAGCERDGGSPPPAPPPTPTFTVGGTVSGLTGSVTLANNGGDARVVSASGAFTFSTPVASGAAYVVTVSAQPANQTCTVAGGSGAVAGANVASVAVTCTTNSFNVGGTVTGLSGSVSLANNGADTLTRVVDGAFTFATPVASGSAYNVTVATQPANQACTIANGTGTIGANITSVTVNCVTYRVTATVGAGGGTVTYTDGAQVVIPPGALAQDTLIGIAVPASGAPALTLADSTQRGSIYEITPHDVAFAKPVLIRLPVAPGATGTPGVMIATLGEGWQFAPVMRVGDFVEYERLTFSWQTQITFACAGTAPLNCPTSADIRGGYSYPVATPGDAIVMTSGGNTMAGSTSPNALGAAGTWDVDLDSLQSLDLTMEYYSSSDCGGTHATLKRYVPGAPPHLVVVQEITGLGSGRGVVTASLPVNTLDVGSNTFFFRMACARPGENESGGGDWITFNARRGAVSGFTLGGTVTGLSGAGLELQNAFREAITVPVGSSTFRFRAPLTGGQPYEVRVRTQPQGNRCVVANGRGTINADVADVDITCTPTGSSTAGYAVVANRAGGDISLFARSSALGVLTPLESTPSDTGPSAVAIHPNGIYAFVANQDAGNLSLFRVLDPGAGSYQAELRAQFATPAPSAIAVDPIDGTFVWVANATNPGTVTTYSLDLETGSLYAPSTVACGASPSAIAVDPSGSFVYTVDSADNSISMFRIGSRGALSSIGTVPNVLAGAAIEITHDGKFAYVLAGSSIGRFSVDANTGQLALLGYTSVNGASSADDLVIRPDGRFLFVKSANAAGASLTTYSIDASTGALTFSTSLPLSAQGAVRLAIDATGTALYATNSTTGNVHTFQVDAAGALTLIDTDASGNGPLGIAVTP